MFARVSGGGKRAAKEAVEEGAERIVKREVPASGRFAVNSRGVVTDRLIKAKGLSDFNTTQRARIQNRLQDIEHVRNGHPAPSGNWDVRDGIRFENREGLLPPASAKGYKEYRVLGKDGKPSGARIVINEDNGNVYYSQHYSDDGSGFSNITSIWNHMFGG